MSDLNVPPPLAPDAILRSKAEIRSWLISHAAELLKVAPEQIDPRQPFASYGLDSVAAIGLMVDLEEWLSRNLPETLVWDYPNIDALAEHLSSEA